MDEQFRGHIIDLLKAEYLKNEGVKMHELIDSFQFFRLSALEVQALLEWAEDYRKGEDNVL